MTTKNMIIIRMDGGIASQISIFAYGLYFERQGIKVKYDLSWFEESSKDLNGIFDRNFDMLKAFKNINFEIATKEEIAYYKKHYNQTDNPINFIKAPAYIGGYPEERGRCVLKYRQFFIDNFKPDGIEELKLELSKCQQNNACAVHVRRGDLSTYNSDYGYPTSVDYFIKSINLIRKFNPNAIFYFFSEELDWVSKEIIPKLDPNIQYEMMDKNGADKGFLDLYLISKCPYIIASHGSFGIYAKILNTEESILIEPKYLFYNEYLHNTIVLTDRINKDIQISNKTMPKKITKIKTKFFSLMYEFNNNKKYKVINILGIKIKLKCKSCK